MKEVNDQRKGQYIIPQKSFNNKLKEILKLDLKINTLFCLIALTQISPLLFYDNISRYGYFSWLLITISNMIIFKEYFMIKKINNRQV